MWARIPLPFCGRPQDFRRLATSLLCQPTVHGEGVSHGSQDRDTGARFHVRDCVHVCILGSGDNVVFVRSWAQPFDFRLWILVGEPCPSCLLSTSPKGLTDRGTL